MLNFLNGRSSVYGRLWYAMRYIDQNVMEKKGTGRFYLSDLKPIICNKKSQYYICSYRQLKNVLSAGDNVLWQYNKKHGLVFYFGYKKACQNMKIDRLIGAPVLIDDRHLFNGLQMFRAVCYAAYISTLREDSPVSRRYLCDVTGLSKNTILAYERLVTVLKRQNIAVTDEPYDIENYKEYIFKYGRACFKLNGKVAWRLPNSYKSSLEKTSLGSMKGLNFSLNDIREGQQGKSKLIPLSSKKFYTMDSKSERTQSIKSHFELISRGTMRTAETVTKLTAVSVWFAAL